MTEIVQTTKLRVIPTVDIVNLPFVFTMASLRDPSNLFSSCQGIILAFILRFRLVPNDSHAERLDKDVLRASLSAEKQTRKYQQPECSVALAKARTKVMVLKKCLSI